MHSVYTQIGVPFFSVRLAALEIRVNRSARALCLHVNRCPRLLGMLGTPYLRVNRCARALGLHVNRCPRVLMYAWKDMSLATARGCPKHV